MRCIARLFAVACAVAAFSGASADAEKRGLKPGDSFKECDHCPEMVVVPAGEFVMGAPPDEEVATEREDQLRVSIARPLAVGRFAVTRGEVAAFVERTGRKADGPCYDLTKWKLGEADRDWRSPGFPQDERHPVVGVNWDDAKAYAAWMTSITGTRYRLLSETEREYVARAGSTTPFWWGNTISTQQANYDGNAAYGGGV